jgi:hypothetical protein
MFMLKLLVTTSLILAAVLSVTPTPISQNRVLIEWVTQPDTTWINIWEVTQPSSGTFLRANAVTGGVTNTVELSGTSGLVFQIQEYKLVAGQLTLVTFFNLEPVPHADFPTPSVTPSQTPQPTLTPVPTNTPISNPLQVRMFMPIVMR